MLKSLEELRLQYYPDHDEPVSQDMRWDYVKRKLDALLPAVSTMDVEAELKGMSKDSKESLLHFNCCFQASRLFSLERRVIDRQRSGEIQMFTDKW